VHETGVRFIPGSGVVSLRKAQNIYKPSGLGRFLIISILSLLLPLQQLGLVEVMV